jgi:hypothetical protein
MVTASSLLLLFVSPRRKKFDLLQMSVSREGGSDYEVGLISHGSCGT